MLVLFKQTINKVGIKTRNLLMIKKVANPSQKEATQGFSLRCTSRFTKIQDVCFYAI